MRAGEGSGFCLCRDDPMGRLTVTLKAINIKFMPYFKIMYGLILKYSRPPLIRLCRILHVCLPAKPGLSEGVPSG